MKDDWIDPTRWFEDGTLALLFLLKLLFDGYI